jgi:hypothetical protein
MTGIGVDGADPGLHPHLLAMDADLCRPAADQGTQRARRLVADEQDRRLGPPQVVLEVMLHPSGIAHARAREDDRATADAADRFALLHCLAQTEVAAREHVTVTRALE